MPRPSNRSKATTAASRSHPILPLDGIEERFASGKVLYAQGSSYVAGFPVTVPRTVLRSGGDVGLKGEYFNNAEWQGKPVLTRIDKQVDFDWGATSPSERCPPQPSACAGVAPSRSRARAVMSFTYPRNIAPHATAWIPSGFSWMTSRCWSLAVMAKATGHDSYTMHFENTSPHAIRLEYAHNAPMFGAGVHLVVAAGSGPMRDQAVQTARQADVVVAFVGLSPSLEGEEMPVQLEGFHGGDRTKINLPAAPGRSVAGCGRNGKPLVVVLMNGSALAVPWAKEHAAAILEAWYPGEEGGAAIAGTLAGDDNPAGRLPVTFYASLEQLPPFEDYSMAGRTYRYFSGQPLYGFGYGLSYTTFAYRPPQVSPAEIKAGDPLTVEVDVTNTGKRQGDEVVESIFAGLRRGARHYASYAGLSESISKLGRPGICSLRSIRRI